MSDSNDSLLTTLLMELNRLKARVAKMEDPHGRLLLADRTSPGSHRAMAEMIPTAAGTALDTLLNGRTVSGTSDAGVFLAIPGLRAGEGAMYGFANGTNAVYVQISDQLRYGKIQSIGDCNSYAVVKECNLAGTVLNDTLITVFPTLGSCDDTSSGFCYEVGATISYMRSPDDPTGGIQMGAYKKTSIGYQCAEAEGGPTNLAHVDDLSRIEPYLTDFFIGSSSTCGGTSHINLAQLGWRGSIVLGYNSICGATNTAGTGGVKVFDFTDMGAGRESYNTNHAQIAFDIGCTSTSANVPTLGGSPCLDNSLPKAVTILGHLPTKETIDASDPSALASCITAVFNEDCTITITWNPPTMRAAVPFS